MRFLIILTTLIFNALPPLATATETQEVVKKARELLQARDREAAGQLLRDELQKSTDIKLRQLLQAEIKQANEIFFTDKGQKLFETAEVKRANGAPDALAQYIESRALEKDNILILRALTLIYLSREDCGKAEGHMKSLTMFDPDSETSSYLQLAHRFCKEPGSLTQEDYVTVEQMQEMKKFGLILLAASACVSGRAAECFSAAKKAADLDKEYPATYYWMWRSAQATEESALDEAQKYLTLCGANKAAIKKQYQWDPHLCKDRSGPEKQLKREEAGAK